MSKRIEGGESNPEARPSIYPLYHLQSQSYYHFQTAGQTYIAYFFSFSSLSHIAQFYIHFQTAVGVLGSSMCRFIFLLLLIPLGVLASTNSKHLLLETAADHPAPLNFGSNHTEGSDYAQSPGRGSSGFRFKWKNRKDEDDNICRGDFWFQDHVSKDVWR